MPHPPHIVFKPRWARWWLFVPRLLVVLVIWAPLPAVIFMASKLADIARDLPETPDIAQMTPAFPSRVQTVDGWHLGGAPVVENLPLHQFPPLLITAFLAAEDEDFFTHRGMSTRGIARALWDNHRAGEQVQGASTMSQQLAKHFLGASRSYEDKIRELLVARRLEATYTKPELLDAYLGGVYFGQQAYGVTQASWRYFDRSPQDLSLNQMATLAGVLPAPSVFNPIANPDFALRERNRVLRRMRDIGVLDPDETAALMAAPLELRPRQAAKRSAMPEATAATLRALGQREHGEVAWSQGGLTVTVPHRPFHQAHARQSLRDAILALDKRQGWRGPISRALHADPEAPDTTTLDARLTTQPAGEFLLARVQDVARDRATIITRGGAALITRDDAIWAEPSTTARHYKRPIKLRDLRRTLNPDDLIMVSQHVDADESEPESPAERRFQLEQWPAFEGALVSIDSRTGELLASVGAFDADSSEFHRGEQGCRQPGSIFKTILFADALSKHLTAATMLSDVPGDFATDDAEVVWQPRNADNDFKGYITLATALALSRNIPTIHLMEYLGTQSVSERASKLGVESHIEQTGAMALGASCARPIEMARVYAAFQRRGHPVDVHNITTISTADGQIVTDHGHFASPTLSTAARLARMADIVDIPPRGVSENVAYIVLDLLRRVVTAGTAHRLPRDWVVAGKTGTTDEFDGWFVGLDGQITTAVWIGSDHNTRPLGRGEHGATVAMPAFRHFHEPFALRRAPRGAPPYSDWPGPPPTGVIFERIDTATGLLSRPREPGGAFYPFLEDTAPEIFAPTQGTRQSESVDSLMRSF